MEVTAELLKDVFGGWSLAGVVAVQSRAPFTVVNVTDRNGDSVMTDRPDIGNPARH